MSNSMAIAAVTTTLRKLIEDGTKLFDDGSADPEVTDLEVTTLPPDKARNNKTINQINLFLYQTMPNAAMRNMDMPRQVRPGESSLPPLALNLYYLITAYGKNNDDTFSHRLLGRAMRVLHDYPLIGTNELLSPTEIQDLLSDSGLDVQPERVRLTPVPMSLDEMSKLWMTFQTQYRISAAYQAAVVLIESLSPVKAALPVLRRGEEDRGADVQASAPPVLYDMQPPGSQPSVRLGEDLIINGKNLNSPGLVVRFSSPRLEDPIEVEPLEGGTSEQMRVHLRDAPEDAGALARWAPGFYTVSLAVKTPGMPSWVTNEVPLALAPEITVSPNSAPEGDMALTVNCAPRVREGQRIILLFGQAQIPVQTIANPSDTSQPSLLKFLVRNAKSGSYVVRLRVDGADSLPTVMVGTPPRLEFDPNQKVTIA